MSNVTAHLGGTGIGSARVTRNATLSEIGSEFHVTTVAYGEHVKIHLTDKEGRDLYEKLAEIYATSGTPGEIETPGEIADRISAQRSIGNYSGLTENTRLIARGAALQAARAARGLQERNV